MKWIIWISKETRHIPGVGTFSIGDEKAVDDKLADQLIEQNLAKEKDTEPKKKAKPKDKK